MVQCLKKATLYCYLGIKIMKPSNYDTKKLKSSCASRRKKKVKDFSHVYINDYHATLTVDNNSI